MASGSTKTRSIVILIVIVGVLGLSIVARNFFHKDAVQNQTSSVTKLPPNLTLIPGAETSGKFASLLNEENQRRALEAQKAGGSAIATIIKPNPASGNIQDAFGGKPASPCGNCCCNNKEHTPESLDPELVKKLIEEIRQDNTKALSLFNQYPGLSDELIKIDQELALKLCKLNMDLAKVLLKNHPELARAFAAQNPELTNQYIHSDALLANYLLKDNPALLNQILQEDVPFAKQLMSTDPDLAKAFVINNEDGVVKIAVQDIDFTKKLIQQYPPFAAILARHDPAFAMKMMQSDPATAAIFANQVPDMARKFLLENPELAKKFMADSPDLAKALLKVDQKDTMNLISQDPVLAKKLMQNDPELAKTIIEKNPDLALKLAQADPDFALGLMKNNPQMANLIAKRDPDLAMKLMDRDPSIAAKLLGDNPDLARLVMEKNPELAKKLMKANPDAAKAMLKANPDAAMKLIKQDPELAKKLLEDPQIAKIMLNQDPTGTIALLKDNPELMKKLMSADPGLAGTIAGLAPDEVQKLMVTDPDFAKVIQSTMPQVAQALNSQNPSLAKFLLQQQAQQAQTQVLQQNRERQRQEQLNNQRAQVLSETEQKKVDMIIAAMEAQAKTYNASWTEVNPQQYLQGDWATKEDKKDGTKLLAVNGTAGAKSNTGDASSEQTLLFKAGTILFGVLDTAVNSDEPGPVMATIVQGPYQGAKLMGSLELAPKGEKVSLSFTTLSLPDEDAKSISLKAVAIDPDTARTALATDTDHHYLLRYGSLFASSFLQGYGQIIAQQGAQLTTNAVGGSVTTYPKLPTGQQMFAALGTVGQRWGTAMGDSFNRPNTVRVDAGVGLGLLILTDVNI